MFNWRKVLSTRSYEALQLRPRVRTHESAGFLPVDAGSRSVRVLPIDLGLNTQLIEAVESENMEAVFDLLGRGANPLVATDIVNRCYPQIAQRPEWKVWQLHAKALQLVDSDTESLPTRFEISCVETEIVAFLEEMDSRPDKVVGLEWLLYSRNRLGKTLLQTLVPILIINNTPSSEETASRSSSPLLDAYIGRELLPGQSASWSIPTDESGNTWMHDMLAYGGEDRLTYVLNRVPGAVNTVLWQVNENGQLPTDLAIQVGQSEQIWTLLDAMAGGTVPYLPNERGLSPADREPKLLLKTNPNRLYQQWCVALNLVESGLLAGDVALVYRCLLLGADMAKPDYIRSGRHPLEVLTTRPDHAVSTVLADYLLDLPTLTFGAYQADRGDFLYRCLSACSSSPLSVYLTTVFESRQSILDLMLEGLKVSLGSDQHRRFLKYKGRPFLAELIQTNMWWDAIAKLADVPVTPELLKGYRLPEAHIYSCLGLQFGKQMTDLIGKISYFSRPSTTSVMRAPHTFEPLLKQALRQAIGQLYSVRETLSVDDSGLNNIEYFLNKFEEIFVHHGLCGLKAIQQGYHRQETDAEKVLDTIGGNRILFEQMGVGSGVISEKVAQSGLLLVRDMVKYVRERKDEDLAHRFFEVFYNDDPRQQVYMVRQGAQVFAERMADIIQKIRHRDIPMFAAACVQRVIYHIGNGEIHATVRTDADHAHVRSLREEGAVPLTAHTTLSDWIGSGVKDLARIASNVVCGTDAAAPAKRVKHIERIFYDAISVARHAFLDEYGKNAAVITNDGRRLDVNALFQHAAIYTQDGDQLYVTPNGFDFGIMLGYESEVKAKARSVVHESGYVLASEADVVEHKGEIEALVQATALVDTVTPPTESGSVARSTAASLFGKQKLYGNLAVQQTRACRLEQLTLSEKQHQVLTEFISLFVAEFFKAYNIYYALRTKQVEASHEDSLAVQAMGRLATGATPAASAAAGATSTVSGWAGLVVTGATLGQAALRYFEARESKYRHERFHRLFCVHSYKDLIEMLYQLAEHIAVKYSNSILKIDPNAEKGGLETAAEVALFRILDYVLSADEHVQKKETKSEQWGRQMQNALFGQMVSPPSEDFFELVDIFEKGILWPGAKYGTDRAHSSVRIKMGEPKSIATAELFTHCDVYDPETGTLWTKSGSPGRFYCLGPKEEADLRGNRNAIVRPIPESRELPLFRVDYQAPYIHDVPEIYPESWALSLVDPEQEIAALDQLRARESVCELADITSIARSLSLPEATVWRVYQRFTQKIMRAIVTDDVATLRELDLNKFMQIRSKDREGIPSVRHLWSWARYHRSTSVQRWLLPFYRRREDFNLLSVITFLEDDFVELLKHQFGGESDTKVSGVLSGEWALDPGVVAQIFGKDDKPIKLYEHGNHPVARVKFKGGDIHVKFFPEIAMNEFAFQRLQLALFGEGVPLSDLVIISHGEHHYPALLTQTINGSLLRDQLAWGETLSDEDRRSHDSGFESRLNPALYAQQVISALVSNVEDGKPDNYIVKDDHIIPVDSDHILVNPVIPAGVLLGAERSRIKCVLFCFDNFTEQRIPEEVADKLKLIDPYEFIQVWLRSLDRLHLKTAELFTEERMSQVMACPRPEELKEFEMSLTPGFKAGIIWKLFENLSTIRNRLLSGGTLPTGMELMHLVEPSVAKHYLKAHTEHGHVKGRFDAISDGQYHKSGHHLKTITKSKDILNEQLALDSSAKGQSQEEWMVKPMPPGELLTFVDRLSEDTLNRMVAAIRDGKAFEKLATLHSPELKALVIEKIDGEVLTEAEEAQFLAELQKQTHLNRLVLNRFKTLTPGVMDVLFANNPHLKALRISDSPRLDRLALRAVASLAHLDLESVPLTTLDLRGLPVLKRAKVQNAPLLKTLELSESIEVLALPECPDLEGLQLGRMTSIRHLSAYPKALDETLVEVRDQVLNADFDTFFTLPTTRDMEAVLADPWFAVAKIGVRAGMDPKEYVKAIEHQTAFLTRLAEISFEQVQLQNVGPMLSQALLTQVFDTSRNARVFRLSNAPGILDPDFQDKVSKFFGGVTLGAIDAFPSVSFGAGVIGSTYVCVQTTFVLVGLGFSGPITVALSTLAAISMGFGTAYATVMGEESLGNVGAKISSYNFHRNKTNAFWRHIQSLPLEHLCLANLPLADCPAQLESETLQGLALVNIPSRLKVIAETCEEATVIDCPSVKLPRSTVAQSFSLQDLLENKEPEAERWLEEWTVLAPDVISNRVRVMNNQGWGLAHFAAVHGFDRLAASLPAEEDVVDSQGRRAAELGPDTPLPRFYTHHSERSGVLALDSLDAHTLQFLKAGEIVQFNLKTGELNTRTESQVSRLLSSGKTAKLSATVKEGAVTVDAIAIFESSEAEEPLVTLKESASVFERMGGRSGMLSPLLIETEKWWVTGGTNNYVYIWDKETGVLLNPSAKSGAHPITQGVLLDTGHLALGTSGGDILILELPTGKPIFEIKSAHEKGITALAPLPGGRVLSAGLDGAVRIWEGGSQIAEDMGHEGGVTALTPLEDGWFLSAGYDGHIRRWQLNEDRVLTMDNSISYVPNPEPGTPIPPTIAIQKIVHQPGRDLATLDGMGNVRFWAFPG